MFGLLSNVAVFFATVAAAIAAIDFFLDKGERTKIGNAILSVWFHLSNLSWRRTIESYRTEEFFRDFFLYAGPLSLFIDGILRTLGECLNRYFQGEQIPFIFLDFAIAIGVLFIVATAYHFFLKFIFGIDMWRNLSRSIYFWAVGSDNMALVFTRGLICTVFVGIISFFLAVADALVAENSISFPVFGTIGLILILPLILGFVLSSVLVIRVLVSAILSGPVWLLERVLRKVSEFEKGPILGIAAVFAAMGVFLKLLE